MRCNIVLVVLVAWAGCGAQPSTDSAATTASTAQDSSTATESAAGLEGRWEVTSLLKDGQETIPPGSSPIFLEFHDGTQTMTHDGTVLDVSKYTLDDTTDPKSIDTIHNAGGGASATTPGIYELVGDELKLCMGSGKPRPPDFSSTPGSGYNLVLLKRVNSD